MNWFMIHELVRRAYESMQNQSSREHLVPVHNLVPTQDGWKLVSIQVCLVPIQDLLGNLVPVNVLFCSDSKLNDAIIFLFFFACTDSCYLHELVHVSVTSFLAFCCKNFRKIVFQLGKVELRVFVRAHCERAQQSRFIIFFKFFNQHSSLWLGDWSLKITSILVNGRLSFRLSFRFFYRAVLFIELFTKWF
jgi:hypothetical protein